MVSLDVCTQKLEDSIAFFQKDISGIRTGRATPALIEHIHVEAYGTKSPLLQLASISAPDPRSLVIQPWDKNVLKDIERALATSDIGVSPRVDSDVVRLSFPPLTEENRLSLVKALNQKSEAAKVSIRQIREKTRTEINSQQEEGIISEDEKFVGQKNLDELIKKYTDKIKEITDKKESEIMTV